MEVQPLLFVILNTNKKNRFLRTMNEQLFGSILICANTSWDLPLLKYESTVKLVNQLR